MKRRGDFLRLQSTGRKVRGTSFLVIYSLRSQEKKRIVKAGVTRGLSDSPAATRNSVRGYKKGTEQISTSRLGVTITRKVDKSAVRRNKLRRRIREIFRVVVGEFQVHADVVVIALTGATKLSFKEVESELCTLLTKARILPQ